MDVTGSRKGTRIAAAVAAARLAAGCGRQNASAGRLSVSARTVAPAGAAATAAPSGGLDLGDGITLTRVRLAVRRIALEGAPASAATTSTAGMGSATASESGGGEGSGEGGGSGSGSGGQPGGTADDAGEAGEVRVGPFAVDLAASTLVGGIQPVFDSDVPPGTYRELRISVGPVADAAAGSALADLAGRSVVVDGTIDGAPFTFSSSLASTRKVEMAVQVAADGSSSGVTLTIDPHGWFRAPDGTRLDPTLDASRAAIEDNVRASIGAELEDEHGGGANDGAAHG